MLIIKLMKARLKVMWLLFSDYWSEVLERQCSRNW